jgi:glycerol kinase
MKAPSATILAIDAGTTGIHALAFDGQLHPVAEAYEEFPQHFPFPGGVEHDAREILDAVDRVVEKVVSMVGTPRVIGVTNQRETVFPLDVDSGETLSRGIVWQDRRTADRCEELRAAGHEELVRQRTGLVLDPYFSASKMEWMLREDASVQAAAARGALRFVTVDALIISHLTGGATVATDPTNASRTMLYDIERREYCDEMLGLFGLDRSMLADVENSAGDFGHARINGTAVPIRGVLGDQQAALFGQGCWDAGSAKITYGTGCFLLLNTGQRRAHSAAGLLTTIGADATGAPCFALEGSAFAGGSVVQWLRDGLGVIEEASESASIAMSVEDTGGVVLVPAFAGLGAPHWDPAARAAILGMTRGTTRAHIVRAGLDSIAFQCAELVRALRADSGLPIDRVLVDGGAAANGYLMQRQADLAGIRIECPSELQTTARGAAAIAGIGAGLFTDPAGAEGLSSGHTAFEANLTSGQRESEMNAWSAAVERVLSRP